MVNNNIARLTHQSWLGRARCRCPARCWSWSCCGTRRREGAPGTRHQCRRRPYSRSYIPAVIKDPEQRFFFFFYRTHLEKKADENNINLSFKQKSFRVQYNTICKALICIPFFVLDNINISDVWSKQNLQCFIQYVSSIILFQFWSSESWTQHNEQCRCCTLS